VLRHLPQVIPSDPDRPSLADETHPMRKVTRQIAFEPNGWTAERREKVVALFDTLASGWQERDDGSRHDAIPDALDRGGPFDPAGPCLELGSGVGLFTPDLAARFEQVVAVDVAAEMLRRADPGLAPRVLGDSAALPFADHSAAAVVLVNMFLFPAEVDRVLRPDGALVFVSAIGDGTPIYLPPEDVDAALPGEWEGAASAAGWGTWSVWRRAR
jgi:SAM-dependent methyltransferase